MATKYSSGKRRSVKPPNQKILEKNVNPNTQILKLLLSATPHYISGSVIANRIGMSRVGVWSRITKLRESGLSIEASQNKGYRLVSEPERCLKPLLEAWLHHIKSKCKVFVYDNLDSTNSEAERLLANNEKSPFVVVSNNQTHGRGRLGRKWYSPKFGNINMSFAFRPNIELIKLKTFTLWQGVYISNLLRSISEDNTISIKWPNDLVSNGKKLAGMLTEASIDSENVRSLIFGIGLNLNVSNTKFPKSISKKVISLKDLSGQKHRIHEITAKLIKEILKAYKISIQEISVNDLQKKWHKLDALHKKDIEISIGKEKFKGTAQGIHYDGSLKIKTPEGQTRFFQSGEVSVSKW